MKVLLSEKVNEIYNISSGVFLENLNLVKTICDLLDVGYELIKFVEDRKGHDFRYAINSAKIRDALGWSPKVSFEVGIKSTVEELYRKFNGE
jgi:dTDP-glucose 4,6-dehydratase